MTPLQQLIAYYQGLLILQYAGLPKFTQFIGLVVNSALCDGLFLAFPAAFNINTAVGAQLTLLGQIIGVPRNVYGISPFSTYFNFTIYSGTPTSIGFNRFSTVNDTNNIDRYQTNATYVLNDFELRALIYLKIIYNNNSNTWAQLKNALWNTFNGAINIGPSFTASSATYFNFTRWVALPASVGFNRYATCVDADNIQRWSPGLLMNISYNVKQPYYNVMQIAAFLNIVPHSMGVSVTVNQI